MSIKRIVKSLMLGCFTILFISCQSNQTRQTEESIKNEGLQSWQDQKFSMFIHWGIYSIPAGIWNGKQISGYSEQIKGHARISSEEYRKLTPRFNPDKWNADSIAILAKNAGMKSVIITSKHHDGFCMFDSEFTEFDVVDATPYKKDVIKELSEACKRHGLKFGVYYSIIDWDYHGALPFTSVENSDSVPPLHHEYNLNQIRELITNYGEISEFWFDMGAPTAEQSKEMAELIKGIQPNCMVSGRIWNDQGDFVVMGDNIKPDFKMGVHWQTPASIFPETWSYRSWQDRPDAEGKIKEKIHDLIYIVSSGGNYLLNIGPKADGSVIPFEKEVLTGVGQWLEINGEAIYGTQVSPIAEQDWGYITKKDQKLYLHITQFPEDSKLIINHLTSPVNKAYQLSNKQITINCTSDNEGLEIDLANIQKDKYATVIVLEYDEIAYDHPNMLEVEDNGSITLSLNNAEKFHSYSGHDYYSSKATTVKLKWYLPPTKNELCHINIRHSQQLMHPLKLSINNQEYTLSIQKSNGQSFSNEELTNIKFHADANNEVVLSLNDKSNPHTGLNIEELEITIK